MNEQPETRGNLLTRDDFISGRHVQALVEAGHIHAIDLNPESVRLARMNELVAASPDRIVWVFGYGSLIWNPAFEFDEQRIGRLHGYHRRYCFWSHAGRGTPDCPGMMLGLDRGGSCNGFLYGVRRERAIAELASVFMRELTGQSYHARLLRVLSEEGAVQAITFVANHTARNYAGRLPLNEIAAHLARASGHLGPCSDYLFNTVEHLAASGIHDRDLDRLAVLVQQLQASADSEFS